MAPTRSSILLHALCDDERAPVRAALCQVVFADMEKTPPEWVELIPKGPDVLALDGRKFKNTDPARVVTAFAQYPYDLPIDWEHATEKKGPKAEEAPAAGWITQLEIREGAIWGRVEWTPRGVSSLINREYRYISPGFYHEKDSLEIIKLTSAGLTNRPALHLAELARETQPKEESNMDPELLKLLGLDEKATKEQINAAVKKLKDDSTTLTGDKSKLEGELATARTELATARTDKDNAVKERDAAKAAQPQLDKFVPRSDYDHAVARAATAEKELADSKVCQLKAAVDAELDGALKAGKITPATVEYHRAQCSQQGGLERFREFVKAAPVIAPDGASPQGPAGGGNVTQLTEVEKAVARAGGMTDEQFLAAKKAS